MYLYAGLGCYQCDKYYRIDWRDCKNHEIAAHVYLQQTLVPGL